MTCSLVLQHINKPKSRAVCSLGDGSTAATFICHNSEINLSFRPSPHCIREPFIMFFAPDPLHPLAPALLKKDRQTKWMFSKALLYFWRLANPAGNEGVTMGHSPDSKGISGDAEECSVYTEPLGIAVTSPRVTSRWGEQMEFWRNHVFLGALFEVWERRKWWALQMTVTEKYTREETETRE